MGPAHGITPTVVVKMFAAISGSHINPAVTVAGALGRALRSPGDITGPVSG